jgi:hypothetical protein
MTTMGERPAFANLLRPAAPQRHKPDVTYSERTLASGSRKGERAKSLFPRWDGLLLAGLDAAQVFQDLRIFRVASRINEEGLANACVALRAQLQLDGAIVAHARNSDAFHRFTSWRRFG